MASSWMYKAWCAHEDGDVLLYVGISDSPDERMSQHSKDKWWWHLVSRLDWHKLSSRDRAAEVERATIQSERPLFNKSHSTLTAGEVLCGCVKLISESFQHCPICHTGCKYSKSKWMVRSLCTADVGEKIDACCFEVRMSCSENHEPIEWTQLVPVQTMMQCVTKMPESTLVDLWEKASDNGEVWHDIPELRPQTLLEMFLPAPAAINKAVALIEAQ